jgi:hypothetical protein
MTLGHKSNHMASRHLHWVRLGYPATGVMVVGILEGCMS